MRGDMGKKKGLDHSKLLATPLTLDDIERPIYTHSCRKDAFYGAHQKTRKPCYRKDNCAMRPIYGWMA